VKNVLILVMLFLSSSVAGTTYFIDPSGNDANNGSGTNPWKTLAYACSRVKNAGDIIHVNAGTYTEISQSQLAVGVSIEGVGVNSIIRSLIGGSSFTIQLYSESIGTKGNQHISNIKMDGANLTAYGAIAVVKRSNVEIYNCTFVDFNSRGINFDGNGTATQPTTYAIGNKFHNNIVTNCSEYDPPNDQLGNGLYLVGMCGQQTMQIYNNTLDQTSRAPGYNGYCIKAVGGFNKDVKIYNNIINKAPFDGTTWDFAIELWNSMGGIEIYNNTITGAIDLSGAYGNRKGSYSYGVWIHNNTIGPAALSSTTRITKGIHVEQSSEGIIIEKNHIKNVAIGVYFPLYYDVENGVESSNTVSDINIRYNIFDNIGVADGGADNGYGIYFNIASGWSSNINGFYIYNNVFIGHIGTANTYWGVEIPNGGTTSNVSIRNNIVENFDGEPVYGSTAVSGLSIENNSFYNNGHNNIPVYSGSETVQNNLISNPLFVSSTDYHLQTGSPASGNGLAIAGLTTDYDGNSVNNPPSIGAYEYISQTLPVYQNSVVEDVSPSLLELNYNLNLANIIPAGVAFNVLVNSVPRSVNSVIISGTKVQLTLASPIFFGDVVIISYTKPTVNPLQNATGEVVASISSKLVTNNCKDVNIANDLPVMLINYPKTVYAGFINEIDASSSYDPNNDTLMAEWTVSDGVPVSTVKSFTTEFLAPVVDNSKVVNFKLTVSDGKTQLSDNFPIIVLPYKPELGPARVTKIEASGFQTPDYPENILDDNTATKWSSNGDNQWLLLKLAKPFKISHLVMAFLHGQKFESYFDIYASRDNITWEHILTAAASCKFSGERQVFDFPALHNNTYYSFLKYVGHGNSLNYMNTISEIKIYGTPQANSTSGNNKENDVIIYPNPARNFFNISIEEPTIVPNSLRIIDVSGRTVFEETFAQGKNKVQIPDSLYSGLYIVELRSGMVILDIERLIINR
jgi:hypothetical protein